MSAHPWLDMYSSHERLYMSQTLSDQGVRMTLTLTPWSDHEFFNDMFSSSHVYNTKGKQWVAPDLPTSGEAIK